MPPRSIKKNQKSKAKPPRGLDIIIENPEPGVVYNIYECSDLECVKPHHIDKLRSKFKRFIKVPWRKKKSLEQCCAKHNALLKIKYKKCVCGREFWGTRLKDSQTCSFCSAFSDQTTANKDIRYYRMGEYHKQSSENLNDPERFDCIYRTKCLKVTFSVNGEIGIACKDCPYYSSELEKDAE